MASYFVNADLLQSASPSEGEASRKTRIIDEFTRHYGELSKAMRTLRLSCPQILRYRIICLITRETLRNLVDGGAATSAGAAGAVAVAAASGANL